MPSQIYAWPSWIKNKLWVDGPAGYMVGDYVILESALGPNPSFFLFCGTLIQLWGLLGQGLGLGLGPGLDNKIWTLSIGSKSTSN